MTIPLTPASFAMIAFLIAAICVVSYLAALHIQEAFKFQEPNKLRSACLADINLDRRANHLYSYLAWHVEDCTQIQPLTQAEAISIATYMVANAVEGMDRGETSAIMAQINENARNLKNQTRQPYRKDAPNVVELTVKKDEVTGDGAQAH